MQDQFDSDQGYRPPKRKSNFDVPPESVVNHKSLSQTIEKLSSISPEIIQSWVPVTDKIITARLEKAILKNFEYLDEKDNNPELFELKKSKRVKPSSNIEDFGRIQNRVVLQTLPTIGLPQVQVPIEEQSRENFRIYISGLPLDFTDEDIDVLFSCQGKIKRIKFYLDSDGNKKGDCLVTYMKSESAALAVSKLDSLDVGDGNVISVTLADFKNADDKNSAATLDLTAIEFAAVNEQPTSSFSQMSNGNSSIRDVNQTLYQLDASDSALIDEYEIGGLTSSLRSLLPTKLECDKFAVMLIRNAYDNLKVAVRDPNYLRDIEADLLIECCQYGKVKSVTTPSDDDGSILLGSILVSFADLSSALNCAKGLHNRWYDKKQLKILLFLPLTMSQSIVESKEDAEDAVEIKDEVQNFDLDNFFNTLL